MHVDEYTLRPYMDPTCLLQWTNFESVWIVTHLSLFCEGIYIRKGFPIANLDFTLRKWWFVLKHCMISHNYPLDIQIPRTEKTFQSKHVTAKCKILSVPCRKQTYPTSIPRELPNIIDSKVSSKGGYEFVRFPRGYPICITEKCQADWSACGASSPLSSSMDWYEVLGFEGWKEGRKLTWQWTITIFTGRYIFKWAIEKTLVGLVM